MPLPMTPDQLLADDNLHAAIEAHARAFHGGPGNPRGDPGSPGGPGGSLLSHWAAISVWIPTDNDTTASTGYCSHYRGGHTSRHEILGLAAVLAESADWGGDGDDA